jgi:DNA (cytosine-5)-methyltransferase 1
MGKRTLTAFEVCAGAGGQAIGLDAAGFEHAGLVDNDRWACETLRKNRADWHVQEADLKAFPAVREHIRLLAQEVDLLAGGVPCPPFSLAGKQLGADDERDLFPQMLRLAALIEPKALMIENVRGILSPRFAEYRAQFEEALTDLGLGLKVMGWKLLQASDFGVPQLRPRVVFIAIHEDYAENFDWPEPSPLPPPTVGDALYEEMASRGWAGAEAWRDKANAVAPTLVGGSKKHGGPDLGPTRAKRAWAELGVDGHGLADEPPGPDFQGMPRLTVRMAATLQGFPDEWVFAGPKTHAYRQVGNAFPPPVARAVTSRIYAALSGVSLERKGQRGFVT